MSILSFSFLVSIQFFESISHQQDIFLTRLLWETRYGKQGKGTNIQSITYFLGMLMVTAFLTGSLFKTNKEVFQKAFDI